ncbi:hypothetical protein H9C73_09750 [Marinobacterium sp. AK62]|uniref:Uncharacterized protein n=1 Tax=Marinobacterium alkalitolerans TaxID=1542925 RepID=A0ABS3ZBE1_9GAMM|nr:DUF6489 family protein [Marinobacterium alkalitolerans]MBP0049023.1 hypothetical protein [Marinobacterium alkalitolerans]
MNFKIDVEMTPEELRRALGLPDVSVLQQEMIDKVREQMEAGAEGYDPLTLLKPYLNNGIGSMEAFQKLLFGMMNQYGKGGRDAD